MCVVCVCVVCLCVSVWCMCDVGVCVSVCVCVSVGEFEKSVVGLCRLRSVCTAPHRQTCPEVFRWNSFARKSAAHTDCVGNHANLTVMSL